MRSTASVTTQTESQPEEKIQQIQLQNKLEKDYESKRKALEKKIAELNAEIAKQQQELEKNKTKQQEAEFLFAQKQQENEALQQAQLNQFSTQVTALKEESKQTLEDAEQFMRLKYARQEKEKQLLTDTIEQHSTEIAMLQKKNKQLNATIQMTLPLKAPSKTPGWVYILLGVSIIISLALITTGVGAFIPFAGIVAGALTFMGITKSIGIGLIVGGGITFIGATSTLLPLKRHDNFVEKQNKCLKTSKSALKQNAEENSPYQSTARLSQTLSLDVSSLRSSGSSNDSNDSQEEPTPLLTQQNASQNTPSPSLCPSDSPGRRLTY